MGRKLTEAEEIQATAQIVGVELSLDECKELVRRQKESGLPKEQFFAKNLVDAMASGVEVEMVGTWKHHFEFWFVTPNEHKEEALNEFGEKLHKVVSDLFKEFDADGEAL